jgi:hypothetical protein
MHRRTLLSWLPGIAAVTAVVIVSACSGSADEQQVIKKYFDASRLRDQTTLANIATVSFRPSEDGVVQSFSIASISDEQPHTLRIKELSAAYDEAKKADDEFSKRKNAYQEENIEAIARVLKAEASNTKLRGKDLEVQQEWSKWREEQAAHSKAVSEAQQALAAERGIAELSVFNAANPVNVNDYDGQLITKEVTINASVKTPDNKSVDRKLLIRLSRAELKNAAGDQRSGRWIITEIKDVGA